MAATRVIARVELPAAARPSYFETDAAYEKFVTDALDKVRSALSWAKDADAVRNYQAIRSPIDPTVWITPADVFPKIEVTFTDAGFHGRVLKLTSRTVKVMSDVWEDEAYVVAWDGEKVVDVNWSGFTHQTYETEPAWKNVNHYRPGFEPASEDYNATSTYANLKSVEEHPVRLFTTIQWVADATEETQATVRAWEDESRRVGGIKSRAADFARWVGESIQKSSQVRRDYDAKVVKGRKVKPGTTVRVKWVGDGQYGPYANVQTNDGKEVKFVSLDNLEAVPDWNYTFREDVVKAYGLPTDVVAVLKVYADERSDFAWGVVCDRLGDLDTANYAGEEFARYLRECKVRTDWK